MSSLKDRETEPGTEETRRKPPTTAIAVPRRGVIVALRDAELGRKICSLASPAGLDAAFVESVQAALESWSDAIGVLIVDASFAADAVPLVEQAARSEAVVLVAGSASDGEGTLCLLDAGARIYVPLPESPERIAGRLREIVAREVEQRGETNPVELAKAELQAAFDTFPSPLVVIGRDLTIRRANRAALLLSRRGAFPDILGQRAAGIFQWSGEEDGAIERAMAGREDIEFEFEVLPPAPVDAAPRVYRCRVFASGEAEAKAGSGVLGSPGLGDGALLLLDDVTFSTREEAERARREKLEAVALLAATLSHEINQPLGTILGRAQLAQLGLERPDAKGVDLHRDLKDIVASVERISGVLERLHEVTDIVTKTYPGGARMLDLEQSIRTPERK
jgi:DNA-binding response OmpR family regulator